MPFKFKLSKRLALMKAALAASAVLTLACTSDLTDPQPHRNSLSPFAISSDLVPLTATAVAASGYEDPNVPQSTLDNNLATRWSAEGDGQWIRYDLGAVMAVGPVDIAWYRGTDWASAFEIQVSLDSVTWTPVFAGRSSGQTLQPERYDFPTVTGRYVRIVGHGQWSSTTLLSLWNSITEVAIYASTAAPLSSAPVAAVTASVYHDPNVPQNTLDNNLATRWSAHGDGQWIRYDLGATMTVGPVTIAWYEGTSWQSAFEIQVSLDSVTWTPVFSGRSSGQTLQPERYDFPATTGRYVRIVGHGQWNDTTLSSWWNSITEVAIYASSTTPVSSVPLAAVTASAYEDPNVPQNTLDNNLGTRWSANGDGQWIRYDLGSTMNVGPVTIAWYQGTAWQSAFEIQVSLDSITWTSVYSGRSSGQTLQPERYDFPSVTARYVRIVGHGQWSGTTPLSAWNSITEVVIYDSPDSPAGPITPLPAASVTVSPASVSLSVGQTLLLSVVLKDSAGDFLTDRTVTWTTSNSAVATVSASGLVTGVTVGTATITATSRGVSGKAATSVASTTSGGAGPQPGPTDPIILQDGFESGDLNSWTQDPAAGRYSLSTDPTRVHSGNSSLQALYTPTNGYGLITRWFMPGYDEVYVKFYVMFQAGFENNPVGGNPGSFRTARISSTPASTPPTSNGIRRCGRSRSTPIGRT